MVDETTIVPEGATPEVTPVEAPTEEKKVEGETV